MKIKDFHDTYKSKKKEQDKLFDKKMRVFQKALREANKNSLHVPSDWPILNTLERRFWILIMHKRGTGGFVSEESGYVWNIDSPINNGYVLIVDTETGKYAKTGYRAKYVGRATPWFAQYLPGSGKLVAQFYDSLVIYKLNPEETTLKKLGSATVKGTVDFACENKRGDLIAYTSEGSSLPNLISLTGKLRGIHLPGFSSLKRILGVDCFYEKGKMKIIAMRCIQDDKFRSDPTYSLAIFVENGKGDRESYWHFSTFLYDCHSPKRIEFHEDPFIQEGFVKLTAYGYEDSNRSLLGQYLVPKNLDQFRDKSK